MSRSLHAPCKLLCSVCSRVAGLETVEDIEPPLLIICSEACLIRWGESAKLWEHLHPHDTAEARVFAAGGSEAADLADPSECGPVVQPAEEG